MENQGFRIRYCVDLCGAMSRWKIRNADFEFIGAFSIPLTGIISI